MSDKLKIQLLKIALALSREYKSKNRHAGDFTVQRIVATYWEVYTLFEEVSDGLANRSSSISPETNLPFLSNHEQL